MKKEIASAIAGLALGAGGAALAPATIDDVKKAQDTYFAKHGEYFECHVYDGPQGKGYQVFYKEGDEVRSEGKGPEVRDFKVKLENATTT